MTPLRYPLIRFAPDSHPPEPADVPPTPEHLCVRDVMRVLQFADPHAPVVIVDPDGFYHGRFTIRERTHAVILEATG